MIGKQTLLNLYRCLNNLWNHHSIKAFSRPSVVMVYALRFMVTLSLILNKPLYWEFLFFYLLHYYTELSLYKHHYKYLCQHWLWDQCLRIGIIHPSEYVLYKNSTSIIIRIVNNWAVYSVYRNILPWLTPELNNWHFHSHSGLPGGATWPRQHCMALPNACTIHCKIQNGIIKGQFIFTYKNKDNLYLHITKTHK